MKRVRVRVKARVKAILEGRVQQYRQQRPWCHNLPALTQSIPDRKVRVTPAAPNHNKDGVIGKMLKMWESFVERASVVRLPIPIFLRVSIPLMLACIEGIMTASVTQMPHTGVVGAAEFDNILNVGASLHDWKPSTNGGEFLSEDNLCMLANMAGDFHNISLELIGDTGAAHDIGSERAILEQGIAPELLEMWKGVLDRPVKLLAGGGIQVERKSHFSGRSNGWNLTLELDSSKSPSLRKKTWNGSLVARRARIHAERTRRLLSRFQEKGVIYTNSKAIILQTITRCRKDNSRQGLQTTCWWKT